MDLVVALGGEIRCVYAETLDLRALGAINIQRASHVEPTESGGWLADLQPIGGPILGPFALRSLALDAEQGWLARHWLAPPPT